MKKIKLKLLCLLCILFLFNVPSAFAEQRIVELKKCPCSSDVEQRNKAVIENAIRSDVILQLPEGNFSSDSLSLNGVNNFTIKGTADSGTIKTKLKILQPTGVSVSNALNVKFENLEIEGNTNSNLVVLSEAGDMSADNLLLTANTGTAYTDCLRPDLDWLVPVISLILN